MPPLKERGAPWALPEKAEMLSKESIIDHLLRRIIGSSSFNFKFHLKECLMYLPEEDLRRIVYERNVHILATTANTVMNLDPVLYDAGIGHPVLVVFTADFDKCAPHEIIYTIAHEFAHVFLDHYLPARWRGRESEVEADRQVVKWGFERQLRQTSSNYLGQNDKRDL